MRGHGRAPMACHHKLTGWQESYMQYVSHMLHVAPSLDHFPYVGASFPW